MLLKYTFCCTCMNVCSGVARIHETGMKQARNMCGSALVRLSTPSPACHTPPPIKPLHGRMQRMIKDLKRVT